MSIWSRRVNLTRLALWPSSAQYAGRSGLESTPAGSMAGGPSGEQSFDLVDLADRGQVTPPLGSCLIYGELIISRPMDWITYLRNFLKEKFFSIFRTI